MREGQKRDRERDTHRWKKRERAKKGERDTPRDRER